ncbi:MAG TPA: DNA recombination protein RmuC [Bacillota bacterium]|nr:DNA recombination protein RmuC [Bacillota bacterium]HOL10368.1 DNA recombination protein RmuC [Bacillota bacterium]HPO98119.1 DNA recombination protein RmuC [Bacillota bacterium]
MTELYFGIFFVTGCICGALVMRLIDNKIQQKLQDVRLKDQELIIGQLKESFATLSYEALYRNSQQLLNVANEVLKSQSYQQEQNLETKKQLIDQNLEQLSKELTKVHNVICELEKDREKKYGEISYQLKQVTEQTIKLQETTQQLKSTLTNPKTRGQWGERMAEDILKLIGFVEGINYRKQQCSNTGSRPDYTFYLPKNLILNMDVKFPLDNYLNYLEAEDFNTKEYYKQQFLKDVRNRIKEVTGRNYISAEEHTLDYVLIFIPNEQIYNFINETDLTIIDEGLKNKAILCSPSTLYAFLAVIRQAVDNFHLEQATSRILALMGNFYKQWEAFCFTLEKIGRRIEDAQKEYLLLTSVRRNQLEKTLTMIEEVRQNSNIPLEDFQSEVAATKIIE